jgi:hypothetical protein
MPLLIFGCFLFEAEAMEKSGIKPCSLALGKLNTFFEIADFADKKWVDKKFTFAFLSQLAPLGEDVVLHGCGSTFDGGRGHLADASASRSARSNCC